jgi:hypothetical protein
MPYSAVFVLHATISTRSFGTDLARIFQWLGEPVASPAHESQLQTNLFRQDSMPCTKGIAVDSSQLLNSSHSFNMC